MNYVWTIAGSDGSGGAGIQADLKTFHDFNVLAGSIITAITAQNTQAVHSIHYVAAEILQQQINALAQDLPATVIKLGMQGELEPIIKFLKIYQGFVVCDPVMAASTGENLLINQDDFIQQLIPQVDLLTPNIIEAEFLTGIKINNYADMQLAAHQLLQLGVKQVYLKGGHLADKLFSQDYYTDGKESFWLSHQRIDTRHTHGSGCSLASAIAACIAQGYCIKDALVIAKMYIQQGIRLAFGIGSGVGAVAHLGFPHSGVDLPYFSEYALTEQPRAFAPCNQPALGLYPIVENSQAVFDVIKAGATTVQLRIKNGNLREIECEISSAIKIAQKNACRLFINDYWQLAIKHKAYGVHLGQGDLVHADLTAIRTAGLRLGISTHCFYEVARAHAVNPSYMACGPIFPTTSKIMPFPPQGLQQLTYWRKLLNYPLVAIGGINKTNIQGVLATGVDGIAMISATAEIFC